MRNCVNCYSSHAQVHSSTDTPSSRKLLHSSLIRIIGWIIDTYFVVGSWQISKCYVLFVDTCWYCLYSDVQITFTFSAAAAFWHYTPLFNPKLFSIFLVCIIGDTFEIAFWKQTIKNICSKKVIHHCLIF